MEAVEAARLQKSRPWQGRTWHDRDYRNWLLGILALVLALRLLALYFARTDLFFDEAQYWAWSRDFAFGYFSKPPLIAWIIGAATGICGDAEWCLRAPSAIIHTLTAIFIFLTARALYDARVGFWSAIVFATLPAVSFSALLISTDVPLLAFWTLALYGWIRLVESRSLSDAALVGASLGFALLSKYAAIYFVLCAAIDAWQDRRARDALRGGRGLLAGGIALAIVAPNLWWNATHGFATFSHTADNAGWSTLPFNIGAALEFFASQFAVFGPILFAALIVIAWRAWREGCEPQACRLLAFSLPVILLLVVQALLSRAFANWAAAAYPAATILVTAVLLQSRPRLFRISLWLHVAAAIIIALGAILAPRLGNIAGPEFNPYSRVLGWKELAEATRRLAQENGAATVLTDNRETIAELNYYLRDAGAPILIWSRGERPRNHYEMTAPYSSSAAEPLLYVTLSERTAVPKYFRRAELIRRQNFPSDAFPAREARFYLLRDFESRK